MSEKSQRDPQSRASRRQAMVKERRNDRMRAYKRNRRELLIIKSVAGAIAVIVIAAIVFVSINALQDRNLNQAPAGVVNYTYTSNEHVDGDIDYSSQAEYKGEIPPAGGPHNTVPQTCAVYAAPIRTENAVHSLEHGAVWITYQPDLPADQVEKLKKLADGDDHMLMSPYPGLPAPIVLTAWNHQVQLQAFDETTVKRFMRAYKFKKGVTPEYPASCAGTDALAPTP